MTSPSARPLAAIEKDLRSCRVVRLGAELELVHVRRRQAELADIEAVLLDTIELRREQADRLLDERLAAAVDGACSESPSESPAESGSPTVSPTGSPTGSESRGSSLVEPGRS